MAELCRFRTNCTRADCWFSHPDRVAVASASQPWIDDRFCTWAKDRIAADAAQPCKYGALCTRADCWFTHPEVRVAADTAARPCNDGSSCTRRDCWFSHPPDRVDPNSDAVVKERFSRSLFVGRLSIAPAFETTDDDLRMHFAKFGDIVACAVARAKKDKQGKSRGFGHVEFHDRSSADRAVRARHPSWNVELRKFQPSVGAFVSAPGSKHWINVESKAITLHPRDIKFTHGRISFCFADGKLVDDTIDKCMDGSCHFEDTPPMHVIQNPKDGQYYSISNRRLFVARVLSNKGFKFGSNRDSETVEARHFQLSNKHVMAKFNKSYRNQSLGQNGRFAVPDWRCGTCKCWHSSKYIEDQVPSDLLRQLRTAMDKDDDQRRAAHHRVAGTCMEVSDDDFSSDVD